MVLGRWAFSFPSLEFHLTLVLKDVLCVASSIDFAIFLTSPCWYFSIEMMLIPLLPDICVSFARWWMESLVGNKPNLLGYQATWVSVWSRTLDRRSKCIMGGENILQLHKQPPAAEGRSHGTSYWKTGCVAFPLGGSRHESYVNRGLSHHGSRAMQVRRHFAFYSLNNHLGSLLPVVLIFMGLMDKVSPPPPKCSGPLPICLSSLLGHPPFPALFHKLPLTSC